MFTKSFIITSTCAALIGLVWANTTFAADEKIETIYISATRSEGPQMPVASQIKVVDAEQIRLSGATTITEVLRSQAGIQIQDADGSGGRNVTVVMRGFASTAANNTLILVDGRKLNNPSLAGPALNTVDIKDIERVEIMQGSAGVLFGDQAVGGVINIITHKAKKGELKGAVSADIGSDDLTRYSAHINQGFLNGLSYSLSAQQRKADNYRDNNASDAKNVLANIGATFEAGSLFLEKQKIEDDLRLAGPLSDKEIAVNSRQTLTPNDFSNQDTDLTRVGGEVSISQHWKLLGEYADRDETTNGYFYGDFTQNMRVKNITPRVIGNIKTANGASIITLGYDKSESNYTATTYTAPNYDQTVDGFYGQIIYPLLRDIAVTAGVRHSSVDDTNNKTKKQRSDSLNATELGVSYQMTSAWKAFARSADGFRFANADENGFALKGIDFLNAQTSKSKEVGVSWAEKNAQVSYSLYQMDIDNEITFDPIAYRNINLPSSERQGFVFDGSVQLSDEIGLRGNYTYTDASLTSGNLKGKTVPFVAKNSANIGIAFSFMPNLTATVDANYTGSRFHADDYQNTVVKVDAATLFNLNILWDIKSVELGLRIKNITSETYSDYNGVYGQYPQAGRTYSAHASYRF